MSDNRIKKPNQNSVRGENQVNHETTQSDRYPQVIWVGSLYLSLRNTPVAPSCKKGGSD